MSIVLTLNDEMLEIEYGKLSPFKSEIIQEHFEFQKQFLLKYDDSYSKCKDFREIYKLYTKRKEFFLLDCKYENEKDYNEMDKKFRQEFETCNACFDRLINIRKYIPQSPFGKCVENIKKKWDNQKDTINDAVFFTITCCDTPKCQPKKLEIIMNKYLNQIKCKDFIYCIEYGENDDNPHIHGIICANRKKYRTGGIGHNKGPKKGTPERSSCRYDIIKAINTTYGLYNFDIRCEYTNYDRCSKYILKEESPKKIVFDKKYPESKDLLKYENNQWIEEFEEKTKSHNLIKLKK